MNGTHCRDHLYWSMVETWKIRGKKAILPLSKNNRTCLIKGILIGIWRKWQHQYRREIWWYRKKDKSRTKREESGSMVIDNIQNKDQNWGWRFFWQFTPSHLENPQLASRSKEPLSSKAFSDLKQPTSWFQFISCWTVILAWPKIDI